jgi:hypothetical protein
MPFVRPPFARAQGVARHPVDWRDDISARIDQDMPKEISQVFARRARLSSKAIVAAIALTLAALAAMSIAARQDIKTSVINFKPGSQVSVETGSVLIPVVDR